MAAANEKRRQVEQQLADQAVLTARTESRKESLQQRCADLNDRFQATEKTMLSVKRDLDTKTVRNNNCASS